MTAELIDLPSLSRLFAPRSVAVIGASSDPMRIGGRPVSFLKSAGFDGPIYPVNPKAPEIQGLPAYTNIRDIAEPVDLVILAVPGQAVRGAVEDCAAKGVGGIVMFSAGFAEVGEEGRAEQEYLKSVVRDAGIRMMGPNCMGLINFPARMAATFHPAFDVDVRPGGKIGLVSQSGAFGGLCTWMARKRGILMSHVMTTGNEADVEVADCLGFLANDPDTEVILLYIEGCRDGPKMLEALEMARRNEKPVVAIKLGRTEAGAEAAASHTSALAGADAVYDALFKQFGVYRASSIEEFFDIGCAVAIGKLPKSDKVGLMTVSGGVGVLMADDATMRGLDVAEMPAPVQAKVKEWVPFAGVRNPLDITGQVLNDPTLLQRAIGLMLDEGGYDSIVAFQGSVGANPEREAVNMKFWQEIVKDAPDAAITISGMSSPDYKSVIEGVGIPVFEEPTHATRALGAMAGFRRAFAQDFNRPKVDPNDTVLPRGTLTEVEALGVLAEAGLPTVPYRLTQSADEAVAAAGQFDGPVVAKIVSRAITHKTDIGGVRLGLGDGTAVREAYDGILAAVVKAAPEAAVDGIMIAPMVDMTNAVETILGVHRDPVFGPVVMFGLGGIFVEALKDVVFRVAPFDRDEAHRMIKEIRAYPVLEGLRGAPPADLEALATALSLLSTFAAAHGDAIETIDMNPFLVRPAGQGAVALDAVLVTKD
jgi:acyl-CoA synthetase (NDP forming)